MKRTLCSVRSYEKRNTYSYFMNATLCLVLTVVRKENYLLRVQKGDSMPNGQTGRRNIYSKFMKVILCLVHHDAPNTKGKLRIFLTK
jgi:hypothetical protein